MAGKIEREDSNTNTSKPPPYTMTPNVPHANQHPNYYSDKGNLIVQIGETYFKISNIKFWTHSEFFSIVAEENGFTVQDLANEKEARILNLRNVEVKDFERLLWILYPLDHGKCQAKTIEDWEAILKLGDRWKFRDVCNLAARKLSSLPLDPIKKIGIMHRHHIRKEWVYDALLTLVQQPQFPSIEDARVLDLEMTTQLARAREGASRLILPWNRFRVAPIRVAPIKEVICREFGLNGVLEEPSAGWMGE